MLVRHLCVLRVSVGVWNFASLGSIEKGRSKTSLLLLLLLLDDYCYYYFVTYLNQGMHFCLEWKRSWQPLNRYANACRVN